MAIPRPQIPTLKLYRYGNDHFYSWGVLGSVSTFTHFLLAPITLPVWIGITISADNSETRATILTYPGHRFEEMAMWARFPQGMPPDLLERALHPGGSPPGASSPTTR